MRPSPSRALGALCVAAATAATSATAIVAASPATAAEPTTPFISEIHYDNTGTDVGEFVEVEFPAGTSSAGWTVVLYNGSGGAVYDADPLPAVSPPAGGPAVAVIDYPSQRHPERVARRPGAGRPRRHRRGVPLLRGRLHRRSAAPRTGMTSTDIGVSEAGTEARGLTPVASGYNTDDRALQWSGPAREHQGRASTRRHARAAARAVGRRATVAADARDRRRSRAAGATHAARRPAGRSSAASSSATSPASPASTCRTSTVTATPPRPTASSSFSPGRGRPRRHGRRERRGRREFGGQTQINAARTSRCAPTAPRRTCPPPPPLDLPADDAAREPLEGMLRQPGRHAHGQRGLRPDPLRRAHALRGRPAGAADRARPTRHRRGRRPSPPRTRCAGSCWTTALTRAGQRDHPALPVARPPRCGSVTSSASPRRWSSATASASGGCSRPTAPPAGTFAPQNTRPAAPDAGGR